MSSLTDEEKIGTRPLPLRVATAIGASLDELQRLTEAAGEHGPSEQVISINLPVRLERPDLVTRSSGASDVAVVWVGEQKAVTRTERRDDQYNLDVNVSLAGLDEYEVSVMTRLFTRHLRSVLAAARQENSEARITQLLRAIAPPDPLACVLHAMPVHDFT